MEKISYSDDAAAKYVTDVSGWVDRHGYFHGADEHSARWSGCTHIQCKECGEEISKHGFNVCNKCRIEKEIQRYNNLPRAEWDGKTPLYSESNDKYFFDIDELYSHVDAHQCSYESLRLVICKPVYFRVVEYEYFDDDLAEDCEIPDKLKRAIADLNEIISGLPVASWQPGKLAVPDPGKFAETRGVGS